MTKKKLKPDGKSNFPLVLVAQKKIRLFPHNIWRSCWTDGKNEILYFFYYLIFFLLIRVSSRKISGIRKEIFESMDDEISIGNNSATGGLELLGWDTPL